MRWEDEQVDDGTKRGQTLKPPRLRKGDTIGVIAPASPTSAEHLARAMALFSTFGYSVQMGASVHAKSGYLSGDDVLRAQDLEAMFLDDDIKAILCLRGGYGTLRLLDQLDYAKIAAHPKIFVGYSDITALHTAFYQKAHLCTFHGPMLANLAGRHPDLQSWAVLFDLLTNPDRVYAYSGDTARSGDQTCSVTIREGTAQGVLVGGNLSLLVSTLGTPYEIDTRDKILLLEDIDEPPYRVDRMLTQLHLAGKLQVARGIVCTDFAKSTAAKENGWTVLDVVQERLSAIPVPSFYGLPIGHCFPNFTVQIGGEVRLHASLRILELCSGCVS